jgi:hypothetical protein
MHGAAGALGEPPPGPPGLLVSCEFRKLKAEAQPLRTVAWGGTAWQLQFWSFRDVGEKIRIYPKMRENPAERVEFTNRALVSAH